VRWPVKVIIIGQSGDTATFSYADDDVGVHATALHPCAFSRTPAGK
jgi:hypothetical protein